MADDKEDWINSVMGSLAGSERAQPSGKLFARIEREIAAPTAKVLNLRQRWFAAAAVGLVLVLNAYTVSLYLQGGATTGTESVSDQQTEESIISNYRLYDL